MVHWPLMGGLLHLIQRWGAWAGCGPAQSPAPNVTAHPSMASVSTSYYSMWHYNSQCTGLNDGSVCELRFSDFWATTSLKPWATHRLSLPATNRKSLRAFWYTLEYPQFLEFPCTAYLQQLKLNSNSLHNCRLASRIPKSSQQKKQWVRARGAPQNVCTPIDAVARYLCGIAKFHVPITVTREHIALCSV